MFNFPRFHIEGFEATITLAVAALHMSIEEVRRELLRSAIAARGKFAGGECRQLEATFLFGHRLLILDILVHTAVGQCSLLRLVLRDEELMTTGVWIAALFRLFMKGRYMLVHRKLIRVLRLQQVYRLICVLMMRLPLALSLNLLAVEIIDLKLDLWPLFNHFRLLNIL